MPEQPTELKSDAPEPFMEHVEPVHDYFAVRMREPSGVVTTQGSQLYKSDMRVYKSNAETVKEGHYVIVMPQTPPMHIPCKDGHLAMYHRTAVIASFEDKPSSKNMPKEGKKDTSELTKEGNIIAPR